MIVPRSRLLVWIGVVVPPFALLWAVEPATAAVATLAVGLFALGVVADALLAHRRLAGVGVVLPEVVHLSKDRQGALELRIRNDRRKGQHLRVGLPFPREISSPHEDQTVALPAGTQWSRLAWPCTARRRGNYPLERAYLEATSPCGFWAARAAVVTRSELRVYPNLLTERRNLAALFLNRGAFGVHAQRQVGKGREFEKLREYVPGDSFDEIHWKATAKRGRPVTKVFQIERTQEVYLVIDASRLSARLTAAPRSPKPMAESSADAWQLERGGWASGIPVLERFVTAALVLGLAAEQQGDLYGLLTFTDRVDRFVRAKGGQAHYRVCRDALYTLQPKVAAPDFDEVCSFVRLRLRRRALLIFLTALDDPLLAESFARSVGLICRQHLVLVNMIQPSGVGPLFQDPNLSSLDEIYQRLGGHLRWQNLRELEKVLQRRGVRFTLVQNERMAAELVSQYLSVKQRQLL